jgi:hypothetical protein
MANKSTVAGDLRRFATFVKGLTDAADTLDRMQQIDEEANAAQATVATAQGALLEVNAQIMAAQAELVDTRAKASKSVADAKTKADKVLADADAKAADVIEAARQVAQGQANALVAEAQSRHAALSEQVASMGDQLVRMSDDRTALQTAIDDASSELAVVEGKLAKARSSIERLLG